jgi:hypothetical protein
MLEGLLMLSLWNRVICEPKLQFCDKIRRDNIDYDSFPKANLLTYLFHGAENFLESYPFLSSSRNSPHFMEPEGSLPRLQVSATSPYPEPDQISPCPPSHFLRIHNNIILPSTPWSPKWSLSLRYPDKNYV